MFSIKHETENNEHITKIETDKDYLVLYFSYKTLVGISFNHLVKCSINDWGNTTGKFLNKIEQDKNKRIPQAEVLSFAMESLFKLGLGLKEHIIEQI